MANNFTKLGRRVKDICDKYGMLVFLRFAEVDGVISRRVVLM